MIAICGQAHHRIGPFCLLFALNIIAILGPNCLAEPCSAGMQTGVSLEGRSADDPPPRGWTITKKGTDEVVAKQDRKWGFVEVPPGEYSVQLLPAGDGSVAVHWADVEVVADKTVAIKVDSGIELKGRDDGAAPMYGWYVFNADDPRDDRQPVARAFGRWGFTPLPPGKYTIVVEPGELGQERIEWGSAIVQAGSVASIKLSSGIELASGPGSLEPPGEWHICDPTDNNKVVTKIYGKWGTTPLPPGKYALKIRPGELGNEAIVWTQIDLGAEDVITVKLDSGIKLASGPGSPEPPGEWHICDPTDNNKVVTKIYGKWGTTPLPPGKYALKIRPGELGNEAIVWTQIDLGAEDVITVKLDSGIELAGKNPEDAPLSHWQVYDARDPENELTRIYNRWGITPLPPGEYFVHINPGDLGQEEVRWASVALEAGKTAIVKLDSGIELSGKTPESNPLAQWIIYQAADEARPLTRVYAKWGVTPLPPGRYVVGLRPGDLGAEEIRWADVEVKPHETPKVQIASGIELRGKTEASEPPEQWLVYDATDPSIRITQIYNHWGLTPLPAGSYVVEIRSQTPARERISWAQATVASNEVVTINAEPPLEERLAAAIGSGRKMEREVDPEGFKKLEEEIELSIRRGAAWLKTQQALNLNDLHSETATIGVLALAHSGEFERDPELGRRCVEYLLRRRLNGGNATYANSLTAMALRDIDPYRYRARIFECAQWLVENQGWTDDQNKVWGYGRTVPGIGDVKELDTGRKTLKERTTDIRADRERLLEVVRQGSVAQPDTSWDNSNAQFAILALHSAANSGVGIPRRSWERIAAHYIEMQCPDGGWAYSGPSTSYGSMTCSGLASLVIARHHLQEQPLLLQPNVIAGLEWLAHHFTVEKNPKSGNNQYYFLYGLERAGILAGTEFFGQHEWYPIGARYLLKNQRSDGSWYGEESPPMGSPPDFMDTCYAILFLRRATLPLEPSKPAFLAVTAGREELPAALLPAVEVILDSSGSMRELVGDVPKIKIAQTVMADVLGKLPGTIQLGFRLYGHREGNVAKPPNNGLDPAAKVTRLVVPIAPLSETHRGTIKQWVDQAAPWGWTPMVYSVLQAKNDFAAGASSSQTVVLISDGIDTCGGKIDDIAKAYKGSGIDIVLHVVGFDVDKDPAAKKQLMQIATHGGGKYFDAADADGLSAALDETLLGIEFMVINPDSGSEVSRGGINEDAVTLAPGKYVVQISGLKSDPITIDLAADQVLELRLDNEGRLSPAESKQD